MTKNLSTHAMDGDQCSGYIKNQVTYKTYQDQVTNQIYMYIQMYIFTIFNIDLKFNNKLEFPKFLKHVVLGFL